MEFLIPKSRPRPRYRTDIRVARFWKHRKSGTNIEVVRAMLVDGKQVRVVFQDELVLTEDGRPVERSMWFEELTRDYEQIGNFKGKGTPLC